MDIATLRKEAKLDGARQLENAMQCSCLNFALGDIQRRPCALGAQLPALEDGMFRKCGANVAGGQCVANGGGADDSFRAGIVGGEKEDERQELRRTLEQPTQLHGVSAVEGSAVVG